MPRPMKVKMSMDPDSSIIEEQINAWLETALTPQALRVNKIDIGFDLRRGSTLRDVPEEALMLTGDENRPAGRRIPSGRCE
jgi:DNA-directed RNA polymerase sigma subunit (sigma70/sigma32)